MHPFNRIVRVSGLVIILAGVGCQSSPAGRPKVSEALTFEPVGTSGIASGVYWRPCPTPGNRWAMVLPGASGLKIFDDGEHYFRVADALNQRGFDVIVVDYRRAYRATLNHPDVPTGRKISWVLEQVVGWAHESGTVSPDEPAAVIAWSLGAEGLWPIIPDAATTSRLAIKAAAAYYPANENAQRVTTSVPLLILQGEADNVTPLSELRQWAPAGGRITVETYPGANHGFDITTIHEPKTVRLLPLVGPSATFGYDESASHEAWSRLSAFLDANVHR